MGGPKDDIDNKCPPIIAMKPKVRVLEIKTK